MDDGETPAARVLTVYLALMGKLEFGGGGQWGGAGEGAGRQDNEIQSLRVNP